MSGFDAEREIERVERWIREWFAENGPEAKAVIGISGGKDSTIVAKLLTEALGEERVVGVLMPNGEQEDLADAIEVTTLLGIPALHIQIGEIVDAAMNCVAGARYGYDPTMKWFADFVKRKSISPFSEDARINMPARIRMAVLYAVAQSLPGGGRVANTCNASEDYVGYSTKYGDTAGDFAPCADFTVTEMLAIGDALELPRELVHKTPSDGLCGQSDEDKLGFSYAVLDRYIREGVCEDATVKEKIDRMHAVNLHKLVPMPGYRRETA